MKTLRRPMFRKGGEVGGGIMTDVMRENYREGSASERLARVAAQYPSTAVDPLSQFLIQGGLNLASQPASGSGVIADAAAAFKEPTTGLFKGLAEQGQLGKKLALEGEILDIERDQALEEIREKARLKVGKDFRTDQVRPAFENVVTKRAEAFAQNKNPAVKASPVLTAENYTKFTREASPEIKAKFKGFKPYSFDNKGNIVALPTDRYQPGDIIYDPVGAEFLVFDNAGGTYRLNPLTFDIEED